MSRSSLLCMNSTYFMESQLQPTTEYVGHSSHDAKDFILRQLFLNPALTPTIMKERSWKDLTVWKVDCCVCNELKDTCAAKFQAGM